MSARPIALRATITRRDATMQDLGLRWDKKLFRRAAFLAVLGLAGSFFTIASAAEAPQAKEPNPQHSNPANGNVLQEYGIRVFPPRLSAGGNVVDFRFKVLDPAKAAPLTKRENKMSLINPANGTKLLVPDTPKLGPLRQTSNEPIQGRVYFVLFANTQHHVKHGDKVTIAAGECKLENLIVE